MKFDCREDIIQLTPLWEGERFPNGRPNTSVPEEYRHLIWEKELEGARAREGKEQSTGVRL
jgi:hypothetical protein